jgi:hypothetical protein
MSSPNRMIRRFPGVKQARRLLMPPPLLDITGADWRLILPGIDPIIRDFPAGTTWDMQRKPYDLVLSFEQDAPVDLKVPENVDDNNSWRPPNQFDSKVHCMAPYRYDPVSLETMDDQYRLEPQTIGRTPEGHCFVLRSLIESWDAGLSFFDPQSGMVVPQYPRDPATRDEPMKPADILGLYRYAIRTGQWLSRDDNQRAIDQLLSMNSGLLADLYSFIKMYDRLVIHYASLPDDQQDAGAWNRRDLQAIRWMQKLYQNHNIPNNGYRKFSDIASGRNAPEVYYSCLLTAYLVISGWRIVVTNPDGDNMPEHPQLKWEIADGPNKPCDGAVCRPCVRDWIVGNPPPPNFLPAYPRDSPIRPQPAAAAIAAVSPNRQRSLSHSL